MQFQLCVPRTVSPLAALLPSTRAVPASGAQRLIHTAGDASLLLRPCVGVIGTRRPSPAGLRLAFELGGALARAGFVVVSGLARGIDAAAHRGALCAGGRTIAVLGTGLDRAYPPEHRALQAALACDHLVLSQFPDGAGPERGHFPQRDRLMAALTDATVVVEAGPTSGTRYQVAACRHPALDRPLLLHRSLVEAAVPWVASLLGSPRVHRFESLSEVLALLVAESNPAGLSVATSPREPP